MTQKIPVVLPGVNVNSFPYVKSLLRSDIGLFVGPGIPSLIQ